MSKQISLEAFTAELLDLYMETFEQVQGMYLDRGTSLFETLATISSEEASRSVSATCATIAAQVEHIRFYLDVLEGHILHKEVGKVDWGEVWRTISIVSSDEWEASKNRLKETYLRVLRVMQSPDTWENDNAISDSMSIVVHSAYHLGEIRQALCTIKTNRKSVKN